MASTQQVLITAPAPTPPSPTGSDSMSQISSGPAALLYSLSNQMIVVCNKIQADYNTQVQQETDIQKVTIDEAAAAQVAQADDQKWGTIFQAIGSAVGGVCSLVQAVGSPMATRSLSKENDATEANLKNLTKARNAAAEFPSGYQPRAQLREGVNAPATDPRVAARANQIRANNGRDLAFDADGKLPVGHPDRAALQSMTHNPSARGNGRTQLDDLRDDMRDEIGNVSRDANSQTSRLQTAMQKYTIWKEIGTGASGALFQGLQGQKTGQAGQDGATQQVFEGTGRQVESMVSTARQKISETGSLNRQLTDAARSGATAYAQGG